MSDWGHGFASYQPERSILADESVTYMVTQVDFLVGLKSSKETLTSHQIILSYGIPNLVPAASLFLIVK